MTKKSTPTTTTTTTRRRAPRRRSSRAAVASASAEEEDNESSVTHLQEETEQDKNQEQQQENNDDDDDDDKETDEQEKITTPKRRTTSRRRRRPAARSFLNRSKRQTETEKEQEQPTGKKKRRKKTERDHSPEQEENDDNNDDDDDDSDTNSKSEQDPEEESDGSDTTNDKKPKAKTSKGGTTDDDDDDDDGSTDLSQTRRSRPSTRRSKTAAAGAAAVPNNQESSDEDTQQSRKSDDAGSSMTKSSNSRKSSRRTTRHSKRKIKASGGGGSSVDTDSGILSADDESLTTRRKRKAKGSATTSEKSDSEGGGGGSDEDPPRRKSSRRRKTQKRESGSSDDSDGDKEETAGKRTKQRRSVTRNRSNDQGQDPSGDSDDDDEESSSSSDDENSANKRVDRFRRKSDKAGEINPGNIIDSSLRRRRGRSVTPRRDGDGTKNSKASKEDGRDGSSVERRQSRRTKSKKKASSDGEGTKTRITRVNKKESKGKDGDDNEAEEKPTKRSSRLRKKKVRQGSSITGKTTSDEDNEEGADELEAEGLSLECTEELDSEIDDEEESTDASFRKKRRVHASDDGSTAGDSSIANSAEPKPSLKSKKSRLRSAGAKTNPSVDSSDHESTDHVESGPDREPRAEPTEESAKSTNAGDGESTKQHKDQNKEVSSSPAKKGESNSRKIEAGSPPKDKVTKQAVTGLTALDSTASGSEKGAELTMSDNTKSREKLQSDVSSASKAKEEQEVPQIKLTKDEYLRTASQAEKQENSGEVTKRRVEVTEKSDLDKSEAKSEAKPQTEEGQQQQAVEKPVAKKGTLSLASSLESNSAGVEKTRKVDDQYSKGLSAADLKPTITSPKGGTIAAQSASEPKGDTSAPEVSPAKGKEKPPSDMRQEPVAFTKEAKSEPTVQSKIADREVKVPEKLPSTSTEMTTAAIGPMKQGTLSRFTLVKGDAQTRQTGDPKNGEASTKAQTLAAASSLSKTENKTNPTESSHTIFPKSASPSGPSIDLEAKKKQEQSQDLATQGVAEQSQKPALIGSPLVVGAARASEKGNSAARTLKQKTDLEAAAEPAKAGDKKRTLAATSSNHGAENLSVPEKIHTLSAESGTLDHQNDEERDASVSLPSRSGSLVAVNAAKLVGQGSIESPKESRGKSIASEISAGKGAASKEIDTSKADGQSREGEKRVDTPHQTMGANSTQPDSSGKDGETLQHQSEDIGAAPAQSTSKESTTYLKDGSYPNSGTSTGLGTRPAIPVTSPSLAIAAVSLESSIGGSSLKMSMAQNQRPSLDSSETKKILTEEARLKNESFGQSRPPEQPKTDDVAGVRKSPDAPHILGTTLKKSLAPEGVNSREPSEATTSVLESLGLSSKAQSTKGVTAVRKQGEKRMEPEDGWKLDSTIEDVEIDRSPGHVEKVKEVRQTERTAHAVTSVLETIALTEEKIQGPAHPTTEAANNVNEQGLGVGDTNALGPNERESTAITKRPLDIEAPDPSTQRPTKYDDESNQNVTHSVKTSSGDKPKEASMLLGISSNDPSHRKPSPVDASRKDEHWKDKSDAEETDGRPPEKGQTTNKRLTGSIEARSLESRSVRESESAAKAVDGPEPPCSTELQATETGEEYVPIDGAKDVDVASQRNETNDDGKLPKGSRDTAPSYSEYGSKASIDDDGAVSDVKKPVSGVHPSKPAEKQSVHDAAVSSNTSIAKSQKAPEAPQRTLAASAKAPLASQVKAKSDGPVVTKDGSTSNITECSVMKPLTVTEDASSFSTQPQDHGGKSYVKPAPGLAQETDIKREAEHTIVNTKQRTERDHRVASVESHKRKLSDGAESKENKRIKANPVSAPPVEVQPPVKRKVAFTRVKLELLKTRVLKECRDAHGDLGAEKLFLEYWKHLANEIQGTGENIVAKLFLKSFLKTRRLRKAHNQLILALLRGCRSDTYQLDDVADFIPNRWRKRVKPITSTMQKESESLRAQLDTVSDAFPKPLPNFGSDIIQRERMKDHKPRSDLRIPGALSIEPVVRRAATSQSLEVSESAIWVLVIAAREYAMTILKSCANIKKSSFEGKHLRVPQPRPHTLTYKPKPGESARKPATFQKKPPFKGPMQISPLDIHTLVTQLPMGAVGSNGGTVSRISYETTLFNSFDIGKGFTGDNFDDLRRSIVSRMMNAPRVETPKTARKPPTEAAPQDDAVGRISPHGGLGKGAKDLAALRLRSSFTKKDGESLLSEDKSDPKVQPEQLKVDEKYAKVPLNPIETQGEQKTEEEGDPQAAARRGKGYGVKNLRAMLARNKPEDSSEQPESPPAEK